MSQPCSNSKYILELYHLDSLLFLMPVLKDEIAPRKLLAWCAICAKQYAMLIEDTSGSLTVEKAGKGN